MFQEPKLFGKDEDGLYKGRIEEIGSGAGFKLFGKTLIPDSADVLHLSNRRPNLWLLSLFNGYRQIGTFEVKRPHNFSEGQDVIITKKNNVVVDVIADNQGA